MRAGVLAGGTLPSSVNLRIALEMLAQFDTLKTSFPLKISISNLMSFPLQNCGI
jgi:hypothetical protein